MKVRHAKEKAQVPAPPTMPSRNVVETSVRLPGASAEAAGRAQIPSQVPAQVSSSNASAVAPSGDREDRISPDYFLG